MDFTVSKAELLQLNYNQFVCLRNFIYKKSESEKTETTYLKVRKSQKQIIVSLILPKNEQNSLSYSEFFPFFRRIEETMKLNCFRDLLTFSIQQFFRFLTFLRIKGPDHLGPGLGQKSAKMPQTIAKMIWSFIMQINLVRKKYLVIQVYISNKGKVEKSKL